MYRPIVVILFILLTLAALIEMGIISSAKPPPQKGHICGLFIYEICEVDSLFLCVAESKPKPKIYFINAIP